jgi:hypothetical protein
MDTVDIYGRHMAQRHRAQLRAPRRLALHWRLLLTGALEHRPPPWLLPPSPASTTASASRRCACIHSRCAIVDVTVAAVIASGVHATLHHM